MNAANGQRSNGASTPSSDLVGVELIPGDEADAVADAAAAAQDVTVRRLPAVLLVEAHGRLEIESSEVGQQLGRDWVTDDLQAIMASYFGFISRWDEDGVVLEWSGNRG